MFQITPRTPLQADFLLEHEMTRGKALSGSGNQASAPTRIITRQFPRLIAMPRLLHAADRLNAGHPADRDIRDLIDGPGPPNPRHPGIRRGTRGFAVS